MSTKTLLLAYIFSLVILPAVSAQQNVPNGNFLIKYNGDILQKDEFKVNTSIVTKDKYIDARGNDIPVSDIKYFHNGRNLYAFYRSKKCPQIASGAIDVFVYESGGGLGKYGERRNVSYFYSKAYGNLKLASHNNFEKDLKPIPGVDSKVFEKKISKRIEKKKKIKKLVLWFILGGMTIALLSLGLARIGVGGINFLWTILGIGLFFMLIGFIMILGTNKSSVRVIKSYNKLHKSVQKFEYEDIKELL